MSPWLLAGIVILIAALTAQVLIPRIGEARIARRLAENGGEAFVVLEAVPATRLLRRSADRITVRGRKLRIGMSTENGGLAALDAFDAVDISLVEFTTGPFQISSFQLFREGPGPYLMRAEAQTSGRALLDFGGEQIALLSTPLLTAVARGAPLGGRSFPVSVEVELISADGLLRVATGGGTIGGYPAGPIATMIAGAVARRLEINH